MNYELKKRYEKFYGKNSFDKLIDAKKKYSKDQYVRVNLSKTTNERVESFFKKNRVRYSKTFISNCYKIEKSFFNLSSSILALTGQIYMQDLASQIPVWEIDFENLKNAKVRILDMAASPGSKTTQLADLLNFYDINYEMVCLEPEKARLKKLINNIQKHEFENIVIINSTGEDFVSNEKFDIILLDAPCSGNLVGDKDWLNKRDVKGIKSKAALQRKLLINAFKLLATNGKLIYSTCSIEPEEDEMNVDWALKNLKLKSEKLKVKIPFENGVKNSGLKLLPYLSKTQGFFVSSFRKN
jgi:16S rRNA C967 or C1407 C5-methylase (RsmB/RsmF family)